jgi:uncharacterized damage-inducible protein DinB
MQQTLKDYLDVLEALHEECQSLIAGMTQDALDWCPNADMNSLAILAAHIAGAERYWIGDVVMGESSNRDRDNEFATQGVSWDVLSKRLDSALKYSRGALEQLTVDQLDECRTSPRDGRKFSVAWSIAHVLEHTALHLGHMQITKQLVKTRNL